MKYTSLICNVSSKEWGISLPQAYVFSWIATLSTWANHRIIDGKIYYYSNKVYISKELSLISDKPDTIYRIIKSLHDIGVIDYKKIKKLDYVHITEKGSIWGRQPSEIEQKTEINNSEIFPKNAQNSEIFPRNDENSEIFPTYQCINSINELSLNKNTMLPAVENTFPSNQEIEISKLKIEEENKTTNSLSPPSKKVAPKKVPPPRFDFEAKLKELGAEEKHIRDWMVVRKSKKAANTETAMEGFLREVTKSKREIKDVVRICAEKGWSGFSSTWEIDPIKGETPSAGHYTPPVRQQGVYVPSNRNNNGPRD